MKQIFKKWLFTALFVTFSVSLTPPILVNASSNRGIGYVFKSQSTKMYSYPRVLHAYSKYLGRVGKPGSVYFGVKTVRFKGTNYVKVVRPITERLDGSRPVGYRSGYVPRSAVKRVKLVSSQSKLAKKAYWLKTSGYNFWAHPYGTVQDNCEVRDSASQAAKTLYAVGQVKTREKRTYVKVQTKAGKQLGWINRKALEMGPYLDPTSYLTRQTSLNKTTWINPQDSRVKVTSLTTKHELKKLILQSSDGTAIVVSFNGGPNTYFKMKRNRARTSEKEFNPDIVGKNFVNVVFDVKTGQTMLRVVTPDENATATYLVELNLTGDFTSAKKVKTLSYI